MISTDWDRSDAVRERSDKHPTGDLSLLDEGTREVMVTYPEELLHKMLRHNIGRLPVVDPKNPRRVIGYLGRQGIIAARLNRMEEEHVRELGWIGWPSSRNTS